MNVLPLLFVFSAHPSPDLTPGKLCRYAEGRLRSCKWKAGALLGYLIFINSHISLHPYQIDPVVFCQMAFPDKFGIYLEMVKVP
jgi:hypothetical protein